MPELKGKLEQLLKALEENMPVSHEMLIGSQQEYAHLVEEKRSLESVAGDLAHELSTPLGIVSGLVGVSLEKEMLQPEVKELLKKVFYYAERSNKIIKDIQYLSALTQSNMSYGQVNLSDLARDIANGLQMSNEKRKVNFVIADNIFAYGDRTALDIMLSNLLGNAYKFTGKKAEAVVEFGAKEDERGIVYYVRDNGAGFNPEYSNKLFKKGSRLHDKADFKGTGRGLSMAKKLVELHNGRIWAEGKESEGATFYFTLPPKSQS